MSKITESGLAGPEHESDGDVTEEEGHDSTREYGPSLSLSGNLSCGGLPNLSCDRQLSAPKMYGHLGICLNVLRHPYTIIPCLHTVGTFTDPRNTTWLMYEPSV